ncbi:helix-turn-helix transcriptional regulator [Lysinibacillus sp. NPDC096259]|uniref:helix-turn-helix transcriptional regulator n=1 Tax=Lysinibacillus sp. NPDC096259 TaxID=3390583 RepID=UPI003CFD08FE
MEKDEQTILKNADIVIDLSSWFTDNSFQDYVIHFRKVIRGQLLMAIEYQSKFGYSKRTVEPYILLFKYSSWYLYAFCLERNQFRLFKLNRILSYHILTEQFIAKEHEISDSSLFFENNYFKENDTLFDVGLQYEKEDEAFLMDKIGVQKFQFHSNSATITFKTSDVSWAIDFVIHLKDKVKVLEPPFLVDEIKNTIKKISNFYES